MKRHRWFVLAVAFVFVMVHQADKFVLGALTSPLMETFGLNEEQLGRAMTAALIVSAILYPVWGYLFDRFSRTRLLALISLIWGATTWLTAVARSFVGFVVARASTGVDDSGYPGLYALLADYFPPALRGRIYGLLYAAQPLGYVAGMAAGTLLVGNGSSWRWVFVGTGAAGIVLAAVIFFSVKSVPRGYAEPEFNGLDGISTARLNSKALKELIEQRPVTLWLVLAQGLFGAMPWAVITSWFFRYMEIERGYGPTGALSVMIPLVGVLAGGFALGGVLGDTVYKRDPRGRMLVSVVAIAVGAILFTAALSIENPIAFFAVLLAAVIFIPMPSANLTAVISDIVAPEVRATAQALVTLAESIGSAFAPWVAGAIAVRTSLHSAILGTSLVAWLLAGALLSPAVGTVARDIARLRSLMEERAHRVSRRGDDVD